MKQLLIVPELNYWADVVFRNSTLNEYPFKNPSPLSETWRCDSSVIELLFNENFNPPAGSSSSSSSGNIGIEDDNDKPYIYKYRKCNLITITDKNLLSRIQLYRWWSNIMAANCNKFINLFDMQGSSTPYDPLYDVPTNEFQEGEYYQGGQWNPPEPRSPYITYNHWTYFSTNYGLPYGKNDPIEPPSIPPIIPALEDLFSFTQEEFTMLDLLYSYKMGWLTQFNTVVFDDLQSCLSKCIYVYLDAYINNSFIFYDLSESFCSPSCGLLRTLYEKHVVDTVFKLKEIQYGIIWKPTNIINEKIEQINQDYFLILKPKTEIITVTNSMINNREFPIFDNMPWYRKDFIMFRDGKVVNQDVAYQIEIDKSDVRNVFCRVKFLDFNFVEGEKLKCIWSYVEPYSAYSEIDN